MSYWLRDPSIDPTTSPALGAPTGPGALTSYAAYAGGDLPSPGDVVQGAKDALGTVVDNANPVNVVKDAVGQTTQTLFSALLGPGAELVLTGVLATGGVVLVLMAIAGAAHSSKINQEGSAAVASALPALAL